jgi:NTE family protein
MTNIGLVLQGGGALGAYEYGAIARLIEEGFKPTVITGVSIGAINAAVVAGAKNGDILKSLHTLWDAITLKTIPFLPANKQDTLSMFGNPNFFRLRMDFFGMASWTSLCDVSPMHETLESICDFKRLNDSKKVKFAVTATNVATGELTRFSNLKTKITANHILASGSLPPGFPMTQIDDQYYWDGGLFDNTPLRALMDLLSPSEIDSLPIYIIDLFPTHDAVPTNLTEIKNRMMELSFENKFWDQFGGPDGLIEHSNMLCALEQELPANSALRKNPMFKKMMEYRCLKNLKVIPSAHVPMTGGMDFSEYGVKMRFEKGYEATQKYLGSNPARRLNKAS